MIGGRVMNIRFGLAWFAATAATLLLSAVSASASNSRNAPTIDSYSAIDINDFYMFRDLPCTTANCSSPNLVVVMSVQSIADPSFGPTYHFQPNAIYRFNFTTTPNDITNKHSRSS